MPSCKCKIFKLFLSLSLLWWCFKNSVFVLKLIFDTINAWIMKAIRFIFHWKGNCLLLFWDVRYCQSWLSQFLVLKMIKRQITHLFTGHKAWDTRYLPIFMVFEFSSRCVSTSYSTPHLSLSDRRVTRNLQVRCTHQYLIITLPSQLPWRTSDQKGTVSFSETTVPRSAIFQMNSYLYQNIDIHTYCDHKAG